MINPCCVPSKSRADLITISRRASIERQIVRSGSVEGMVKLDGGPFLMGTEEKEGFPADGEGPTRRVRVGPFRIAATTVTNAQFTEFVRATAYITQAEEAGSSFVMPCDVEDIASVDAVFSEIKKQWGTMDFLVHAVAFSDKNELKGRYADSTRENFIRTMVISCYAFTEAAKRAAALMPNGGAMVTLTYNGGLRAMPNYNVMGVAKAALEASVRYLAVDFGPQRIRVNAISAGPIRTLAGAGITDARYMFAFQQKYSPLGRGVTLEELGGAGLYLLSDLSTGVTGDIHFVDSGYNVIAMPHPQTLKTAGGSVENGGDQ